MADGWVVPDSSDDEWVTPKVTTPSPADASLITPDEAEKLNEEGADLKIIETASGEKVVQ